MILFLILGAYGLAKRRERIPLAPAVFLGLYLLFILFVGGDWMPHFRFLVHLLPLLFGLAALGLFELEARQPPAPGPAWRRHLAAKLSILLLIGLSLFRYGAYELRPSFEQDWHRRQGSFYGGVSRWVLQHVWRNESVAAGDIGYLGYISDVDRIVDTMGLTDRHLARGSGLASMSADLDYLFDRNPYALVVMAHRHPGGREIGHSQTDRALLADSRLQQRYRFRTEIFGWLNLELSRSDRIQRESKVFFFLYTRRSE